MKTNASICALLLIPLIVLISPYTAQAAEITANAPHGRIDDTDGVCSLSEAIINANEGSQTHTDCPAGDVGDDVIILEDDVILDAAVDFSNGANGLPGITSPIIIEGNGNAIQRILDFGCRAVDVNHNPNDDPEFRIFHVSETGSLQLSGVTIRNGCAGIPDNDGNRGGGIFSLGNVEIINSVIDGNRAEIGGGLANQAGGAVTISNSILQNNSVVFSGGAIFNTGNGSTVIIQDNSQIGAEGNPNFSINNGGGIFNQLGGDVIIDNSAVHNNRAEIGNAGGVYNAGSGSRAMIRNGSRIGAAGSPNFAVSAGGVLNSPGGEMFIEDSSIHYNEALSGGGGVTNLNNAFVIISNSTIHGNIAESGAGILSIGANANISIENSTISGNTAEFGSGVFIGRLGAIWLNHVTVYDNNIENNAVLNMTNSILARGGYSGSENEGMSNNNLGPANLPGQIDVPTGIDANLALNNNPNGTLTHALLPDSNAIDAAGQGATDADQRGVDAVGTRDIGAFEFAVSQS